MKKYNLPITSFLKKDLGFYRAKLTLEQIMPHLVGPTILDIGAGGGHVTRLLKVRGYDVSALDIKNNVKIPKIPLILFDGQKIPFSDKSFDTSLILTVLHHTKTQDELIAEALRVSRKVIIIEDVYSSTFEKYKTFVLDSVFNNQISGHPHSNKTDEEWKKYFEEHNITLLKTDYWITTTPIGNIKQALYCIEKA